MARTNVNQDVVGGIDTHKDVHAAAALSVTGQLLGTALFPTTRAGHNQLLTWLTGHGALIRVGMEGTGSYGSGLMRHLRSAGISVVEVNRPNRQFRRQRGKSDTVDAEDRTRSTLPVPREEVVVHQFRTAHHQSGSNQLHSLFQVDMTRVGVLAGNGVGSAP